MIRSLVRRPLAPAVWSWIVVWLLPAAVAHAACTLGYVGQIEGDFSSASDVILQLRGTCDEPLTVELDYVVKNGPTTRVFLRGLPPPSGNLSWFARAELGRLPAGIHELEIHLPETSEPELREIELLGPDCEDSRRPGASLLFPYFEVDLADAAGTSTLVSVHNASAEPILARATVWSDWGYPVLGFDLYLEGHAVVPINLRDVLLDGRLPETGAGLRPEAFPGCAVPLDRPSVDPARLRAQLGGTMDPVTGLCMASDRGEPNRAVGFLTVDTTRRCAPHDLYPNAAEYFGELGVAADLNALWGELYMVDPSASSAAGFEALAVPADRAFHGSSFYRHPGDHRASLANVQLSRFVRGGEIAGDTELMVWLGQFNSGAGATCGSDGAAADIVPSLEVEASSESGGLQSVILLDPFEALLLEVTLDELDLGSRNGGLLRFTGRWIDPNLPLPVIFPLQTVVWSRLRSGARFSIGYAATPEGRPDCRSAS